MRHRIRRAAIGLLAAVAVAVGMGVVAAPANAAAQSWYAYKYDTCGAFKSGARGYVVTGGTVDFQSKRLVVGNNWGQAHSYTCSGTSPVTISNIRVSVSWQLTGTGVNSCTISWPPGCTASSGSFFGKDYHSGSGSGNYRRVSQSGFIYAGAGTDKFYYNAEARFINGNNTRYTVAYASKSS